MRRVALACLFTAAALLPAAPAAGAAPGLAIGFEGFGSGGGPQLVPGGVAMVELHGRTVTLSRFDAAAGARSTLARRTLDPRVDVDNLDADVVMRASDTRFALALASQYTRPSGPASERIFPL